MNRRTIRSLLTLLVLTVLLFCAAAAPAEETAEAPQATAEITLDPGEVLVGKGLAVKVTMTYDTEAFPKKPKVVWETSDKTIAAG